MLEYQRTYMDKEILLYNTLSREKEVFKTIEPDKVRMYHCGPTVYWTQHIGNLRAVVMADIVVRTLTYVGFSVDLVRNYTDVGHLTSDEDFGKDKMEKGSKREGLSPDEIANKYIKIYENDISKLSILPAQIKPKATEHIQDIIQMIEILIAKGFAYTTDLAIYFDTSKTTDYTKLSKQNIEENIAGAGSGTVKDTNKKNHTDFALWFFKKGTHKNALQYWHSPFKTSDGASGEGFPGWHIECSAMSKKYLGDTIDIHMGGIEHIPVHHTNEIAQSEAANGQTFADFWLHNEHLLINNAKMSKSDGTAYNLDDVIAKGYLPLALRYLFLQSHYRSKQNFTWEALGAAQSGLNNFYKACGTLGNDVGVIDEEYKSQFIQKITNDFNIPQALPIVYTTLHSSLSNADKLATLIDFDRVLGLNIENNRHNNIILDADSLSEGISQLVQQRDQARNDKDWQLSDTLRIDLEKQGFNVQDTDEGTQITKAS